MEPSRSMAGKRLRLVPLTHRSTCLHPCQVVGRPRYYGPDGSRCPLRRTLDRARPNGLLRRHRLRSVPRSEMDESSPPVFVVVPSGSANDERRSLSMARRQTRPVDGGTPRGGLRKGQDIVHRSSRRSFASDLKRRKAPISSTSVSRRRAGLGARLAWRDRTLRPPPSLTKIGPIRRICPILVYRKPNTLSP